jgi:ABC-type nitrate/sulfonate/bicarbonate transport system substrate-binding protein
MIKKSMIIKVSLVILLTISLLGGCRNKPAITETVRIAHTKEVFVSLIIIAESKGFFAEEGINALLDQYLLGVQALEAMLAGKADLATSAVNGIVLSSFKTKGFKVITSIASTDEGYKIITRKDRGIRSPADLKGKRIGITRKGNVDHFFLDFLLLKNNLTEKDVVLVVKDIDALSSALIKGEIDAISNTITSAERIRTKLGNNTLLLGDKGLFIFATSISGTDNFINKRPETVKKVLRALSKAEQFVREHPQESSEIVSAKLQLKPDDTAKLFSSVQLAVSLDQHFLLALDETARWMIKNKLTDKTMAPDYHEFLYTAGLKAVRPEAVKIIQ